MKPDTEQIENIRKAFIEMESKSDFLNLLNHIKSVIYGELAIPFTMAQLRYYANPKIPGVRYKTFTIQKKSGGARTIHAPVKTLKHLQRCIAFLLQCVFEPHPAANGFIWNKSIVDNARPHVGKHYVFNLDLKDFFPSVDQARVWKCLQLRPFNLVHSPKRSVTCIPWAEFKNELETAGYSLDPSGITILYKQIPEIEEYPILPGEKIHFYNRNGQLMADIGPGILLVSQHFDSAKPAFVVMEGHDLASKLSPPNNNRFWLVNHHPMNYRGDIANIIAAICCTRMEVFRLNGAGEETLSWKNVLPQGAPTSPVLTNIVCQRLDLLLSGLAKRFGLSYTRYADDITFSSMHNVYQDASSFKTELLRIIKNQNFLIQSRKTRVQRQGYRQEATGLLVNERVNVPKAYVKSIRSLLYNWKKRGYKEANQILYRQFNISPHSSTKTAPELIDMLNGKLNFLKMVKGKDNPSYNKLSLEFYLLMCRDGFIEDRTKHLEYTIKSILAKGLKKGIKDYKMTNL